MKRVRDKISEIKSRHAARHRPSGLGILLADSVEYLDGAKWDALNADQRVWMRRDVLRAIEENCPPNLTPRYAMVFQSGEPVAALTAQIVQITAEQLPDVESAKKAEKGSTLVGRLLSPAKKLAKRQLNERMLVAGNLLCWGFHGISMSSRAHPEEIWSGIGEALYRLRRSERLGGQTNLVMIKDFTTRQEGMDALHRLSYRPLETEPDMVLAIPPAWRTYDDYLAALDAKYRSNIKSQKKKLAAGGVEIRRLADLSIHADRIHALYCEVQSNAAVKLVTVPPGYLPSLENALGGDFRCHAAWRGPELVGFVTTIRDGSTAIAYYIGFDRNVAAEGLPIYLRLLHATIADAIDWQCTRLSLGRTALEPKAALGAKPEPLSVWVRHRVPTLNWIIRSLLDVVPHAEPPERSPFKQT